MFALRLSTAALAVTSLTLSFPLSAPAVPGPESTELDQLVAAALASAPSVAALRRRLDAARELVAPAGALPDPVLEPMLQLADFPGWTIGDEDMSMAGAELRQDLLSPGKRRARREVASAESVVREQELAELERRVVAEVYRLYGRTYAADVERRALAATIELMRLDAESATARYASGAGDLASPLSARIAVARLGEAMDDVETERHHLVVALNALLDRAPDHPLPEVATLPEPALPEGTLAELVRERAPLLAVKRAAVEAAERRVGAATLDLKPSFSAGTSFGWRGELGPLVGFRFGLELPFWRAAKQTPLLRAAELELAAAHEELRAAEAEVRGEAARLAADVARAERQVRRYREAILPESEALVEVARAAYEAGSGSLAAVLAAMERQLTARSALADREADRLDAWAGLQALAGKVAATEEVTR